jgi:serine/threonine protein kinase
MRNSTHPIGVLNPGTPSQRSIQRTLNFSKDETKQDSLNDQPRQTKCNAEPPEKQGWSNEYALNNETIAEPTERHGSAQDPANLSGEFGRYEILRKIGEGGMGSVFLAQDRQLDRVVALKVPSFSRSDRNGVRWFYREARSMATIRHTSICPIYDVGNMNGRHYLTMAFIDGRPLSELLNDGEPMMFEPQLADTCSSSDSLRTQLVNSRRISDRHIAVLIRKLASALFAAHEAGVVHRDLKPSNIMIGDDLAPVILDFGVAHRESANETQLTKTGVALGTPYYMAPEQVEGNPSAIGPATDVYALGVIM